MRPVPHRSRKSVILSAAKNPCIYLLLLLSTALPAPAQKPAAGVSGQAIYTLTQQFLAVAPRRYNGSPGHLAAETFIRTHAPVWVSHVVLIETFRVLESVYACKKAQMVEVLKRIQDSRDLVLEEATVVREALAHYQAKGKVSFEDCMILAIARKAGRLPLVTFDKGLGKAEGVVVLTP